MKIINIVVDHLWKKFWWNLVPKRIKEDYKYVGYEIWYLEGIIEILELETSEADRSPYNMFQRVKLDSYKEILGKLKEE